MELTYHTDYALRVLMYAGASDGRRVTLSEIASAYDISKEHLRKVVHRLAREGLLSTVKGRSGGLVLGRDPETIRVGEVVRIMEPSMCIVDCTRQPCRLNGHCSLKSVFDRAREAFIRELDKATLADLLMQERTVKRIRGLAAAV